MLSSARLQVSYLHKLWIDYAIVPCRIALNKSNLNQVLQMANSTPLLQSLQINHMLSNKQNHNKCFVEHPIVKTVITN